MARTLTPEERRRILQRAAVERGDMSLGEAATADAAAARQNTFFGSRPQQTATDAAFRNPDQRRNQVAQQGFWSGAQAQPAIDRATQYRDRVDPAVQGLTAYGQAQQGAMDTAALGAQGRQLDTGWSAWNQMGEQARAGGVGAALGQGAAGNALLAMGMQQQGPSAAEAAMRRTAEDARLGIASQTAGARGDAIGLAMREGASAQADIGAQLSQDVGVQRLNESLAWDQSRQSALAQAAGAYGGAGATLSDVRGGDTAVAQQYADFTMGEAGLNDAMTQGLIDAGTARGLGYTDAGTQQGSMYGQLAQGQDATAQAWQAQALAAQESAMADATGDRRTIWGGEYGIDTAGIAPPQPGTDWGATIGGAALTALPFLAMAASDIRGKQDIRPAGGATDQAYRGLSASSYEYRDPAAPGAAEGRHVGPMAHELAAHPATAGSVTTGTDGRLAVDPGRLTLTNTAELAQQRRDIDRLVSHQATMSQLDDAERRYTEALSGQPRPRPAPQASAADADAMRRASLALAGSLGAAEQSGARQVQALRQIPTAAYPRPDPPPHVGPRPTAAYLGMPGPIAGRY